LWATLFAKLHESHLSLGHLGLEWYLTQAIHRKAFSIIHDKVFAPSNKPLHSHLESLLKIGVLSFTKHKRALEHEDVEQSFTAKY